MFVDVSYKAGGAIVTRVLVPIDNIALAMLHPDGRTSLKLRDGLVLPLVPEWTHARLAALLPTLGEKAQGGASGAAPTAAGEGRGRAAGRRR